MAHHTKDKGDLGVAKANADLVAQGYLVLLPMTEHAPFDLVAYRDDVFWRIQVKYRAARRGAVEVAFSSTWADARGIHTQPVDKSQIDVMCIYCPDTDACYYVKPADFGSSVAIRVSPSRNHQQAGINAAALLRLMPEGVRRSTREPADKPAVLFRDTAAALPAP